MLTGQIAAYKGRTYMALLLDDETGIFALAHLNYTDKGWALSIKDTDDIVLTALDADCIMISSQDCELDDLCKPVGKYFMAAGAYDEALASRNAIRDEAMHNQESIFTCPAENVLKVRKAWFRKEKSLNDAERALEKADKTKQSTFKTVVTILDGYMLPAILQVATEFIDGTKVIFNDEEFLIYEATDNWEGAILCGPLEQPEDVTSTNYPRVFYVDKGTYHVAKGIPTISWDSPEFSAYIKAEKEFHKAYMEKEALEQMHDDYTSKVLSVKDSELVAYRKAYDRNVKELDEQKSKLDFTLKEKQRLEKEWREKIVIDLV
jgi:hypothetical protein